MDMPNPRLARNLKRELGRKAPVKAAWPPCKLSSLTPQGRSR